MVENSYASSKRKIRDTRNYHRTQMQKEMILTKLKEKGCRITKQRLTLIDIILENDCSCCKEIYYKAAKEDQSIGTATVYRMVNTLEEIGAISRKNMYKVVYGKDCPMEDACTVTLDDNTTHHLSAKNWNAVILAGLQSCGYVEDQNIVSVAVKQCEYWESNVSQ